MAVLVALGFMAFMLALCAQDAWRSARARAALRRLRDTHPFGRASLLLVVVAGTTSSLYASGGYWAWSWLSLVGGEGSLVAGTARPAEAEGHPLLWVAPLLFPVLLLLAMPLICLAEERVFRRGAERDGALRGAARAGVFSLSHLIVGVPLAALPGLALAGAAFAAEYRAAYRVRPSRTHALLASTTLHLAYNYLVLGLVIAGSTLILCARLLSSP